MKSKSGIDFELIATADPVKFTKIDKIISKL
jgi:hypothetical protein